MENSGEERKVDLLFELESAEAYLSDDIQQLSYIREEFIVDKDKWLDVHFITNSIEILLKSMMYNRDNIKIAVEKGYELKRKAKEGVV